MNENAATLIMLTEALASEFLEMANEYRAAGDDRYQAAIKDFSAYLTRLMDYSAGVNLPDGRVPATTYWLASDHHIIGRSSFRHHLTPELEHEGGHIGYDIRPSERQKGYGRLILKLTLEKARGFGLERTLMTCDSDNVASAKIIEKNGGEVYGQTVSDKSGKLISRYWIRL